MPIGIYILTHDNMNYINGFINQMEEFARAILDECAVVKEVLSDDNNIKPLKATSN